MLTLKDQPYFGLTYVVNVTTSSQLFSNPAYAAAALESYLTNQTGPLVASGTNLVGTNVLPK